MFILSTFFMCFINYVYGAKILCVFVSSATSHQNVFQPLCRELSLRGHEVTVITSKPLNDPNLLNLTEINVSYMSDLYFNLLDGYVKSTKMSPWLIGFGHYPVTSYMIQRGMLQNDKVKELIKDRNHTFDLVVIEFEHPLLYGFGERFKCPMVGFTVHYANVNAHFAMGNPSHPITAPEMTFRFIKHLSLLQRLESVLYTILNRLLYKYLVLPIESIMARKYFDGNCNLGELENNVSLLLTATHPLIHGIRPTVPSVIELGGFPRLTSNQSIPKEVQGFLDNATNGVIYFSLGSLMKCSYVFKEKLRIIEKVFSELPQKVLWKCENHTLLRQNDNIMIKDWMPQKEILQHKEIKVFITQGGPQSIEEALTGRVPILAIPLQYDHFAISKRVTEFGIGRILDIDEFNEETFKEAVRDVINNPKYKEKVVHFAELVEDKPMNGLEKAVWWIEYVIRHGGATHLRSPELDVPFYQYYFLDVILVAIAVLIIFSTLIYKVTNRIMYNKKNIKID